MAAVALRRDLRDLTALSLDFLNLHRCHDYRPPQHIDADMTEQTEFLELPQLDLHDTRNKEHDDEPPNNMSIPDLNSSCNENAVNGRQSHRIIACLPTLFASMLTVILLYFTTAGHGKDGDTFGCDPGGNPWVYGAKPRSGYHWTFGRKPDVWWDINFVLTINAGFGKLNYSVAKLIDVAWDLIVGRGAQALGAVAIYLVFRGPIADPMGGTLPAYHTVLAVQYSTVAGAQSG